MQSQIKAYALLLVCVLTNAMGQALSSQVPQSTGQISGRVFSQDTGKPLARVNVTLGRTPRAADTSVVKKTATDGSYEFGGLVPGDYAVSAYLTGFARSVYGMELHPGGWRPLTLSAPGKCGTTSM